MNRAAIQNQPPEYLDARHQSLITGTGPVAKDEIHVDEASRIEALLWKLRIRLLFIGAVIATRQ